MTSEAKDRAKLAAKSAAAKAAHKSKEKSPTKRATDQTEGPPPPRPSPRDVIAYYDEASKTFWARNGRGEWMERTQSNLKLLLRHHGFSTEDRHPNGITYADAKILKIMEENSVNYAGPIAGYQPGLYDMAGSLVLVTRGPRLIEPKRGASPTLKWFFHSLLGKQWRFFYSWLKHARQSLSAGPPWRPGQLLAIAGPPGCGKSLCQLIITEILGGRTAKPYRYMTGQTSFNKDLMSAEHLMIEDEPSSFDLRTRRHFGSQIKNMSVNKTQSLHPKGADAFTVTPFCRISCTLNDQAENLMVLPPLDADLRDKVILLKAFPVPFPNDSADKNAESRFWATLMAEIPAFLYSLDRWDIPDDIKDPRFGVKAFHHQELLDALDDLSPENKLWSLIVDSGILDNAMKSWSGSSSDLERELRQIDKNGECERLLTFNTACGVYLSRLESKNKASVFHRREKGNFKLWTLIAEKKA